MNLNLFRKYLGNNCSSDEVNQFLKWIQKEINSSESKLILKSYWASIKNNDSKEDELLKEQRLNAIHHQINLNRFKQNSRKKKYLTFIYRAAVILLLPVITLLVYTNYIEQGTNPFVMNEPIMNEIYSPVGSRISLSLSDGTKVWLNHGSSLIYPQQFTGKNRTVKLQGEGYFEVVKNEKKPFVVETKTMNVIVTGTAFNVKSYEADKTFEATLKNGRIHLQSLNHKDIEMLPGQHCNINKISKKYRIREVDPEKYISWKDGKLIFEDDSFVNIVNRISRWYNVDIEILDPAIKELTYNGTFIDEPLYQILEMLEVVSPVQFQMKERIKQTDGSYSKRKITVKLKK